MNPVFHEHYMEKKDIISITPTQSQLERALSKVARVEEENGGSRVMNEYSKMGGNRTVGAFLLEEVFYDKCVEAELKVEDVSKSGNRHYDFKFGSYKIDAKAKYTTYHQVFPEFNAGIYEYEVEKDATHYAFGRIHYDKNVTEDSLSRYLKVFLVGQISKKRFLEEAKVVRKGEKDPFGDGRGCDTMDEDCRVIQIKSLSPFKKFKDSEDSEDYWDF